LKFGGTLAKFKGTYFRLSGTKFKKVGGKFGGFAKSAYLCTRIRQNTVSAKQK
jgi:hypothetical protein